MRQVAVTGAAAVLGRELDGVLQALPEPIRARAVRAERVTQLALAASGLALERAGRGTPDDAPCSGHGIVLGTAFGCFLTNAAYQRRIAMEGVRAASPRLFAATVSNAAAGEIGIAYRLGGPAVTVSAGAAAGLVAIGHAMDLVASGRADLVVTGGTDASGPALERWLADGGLTIGEGPIRDAAAIVVLEPARGDRSSPRLLGYAHGFARPGDDAAAIAAVAQALDEAGVAAAEVAVAVPIGAPAAGRALDAALAVSAPSSRANDQGETFAAGGPLALLDALASAPASATVLVVQACASGHVAAVVAVRGDAA
jgi:Beta-ketoacyl synthase, N-terminal domain